METQEINKNQLLSIKSDLITLIISAVSIFILNWHINNIKIIAGIVLVIITGYGITILFFPKKNEISFLSRLILSPILGIILIGFWSIILNYTQYHEITIYYELAIIPILLLLFITRTIRFLRSGKYVSSASSKIIRNNSTEMKEYNNLNTAQAAAKAEKEKLMKINKKIGTTESISGYVSPSNRTATLDNSSKSTSSMPQPPKFSKYKKQNNKKVESKHPKKESKIRSAFKSQRNSKVEKSNNELEIIKIRESTRDIILILVLTIISGISILLPLNSAAIKSPFIILLLFFISGYCILSGIFLNFSNKGLFKKIISSILLSTAIVLGMVSLLCFMKIHIQSIYLFEIIITLSLFMGILGYLRKTRHQKRLKESFKLEKKYPVSEKSEFDVLTVSQSQDSINELKNNLKSEKNILKKNNIKNSYEKPMQEIQSKKKQIYNDPKINTNTAHNIKDQKEDSKEKIPSINKEDNRPEKFILTPSDARKIVMSRKKDIEKRGHDKNKSSYKDDKSGSKKNLKFWKSNKPILQNSINEISKKEYKKEKSFLENETKSYNQLKNKNHLNNESNDTGKDIGIQLLKADIALAEKELKKKPFIHFNKKSEIVPVKHPAKKNYFEKELDKSFSAADVFDDKKDNNPIKKQENHDQKADNRSRLDKILSIILIISLVLAIATTAYIIVKPKEGEKFTEFYILGPDGKASDYPTNLTLGQSGQLFVGVVNHEYSTVNYKVVVTLQGKNISTENISLKNNQKWEKLLNFTPDTSGTNQKLELILYKLPDDKNAYRSLHLWVNVS